MLSPQDIEKKSFTRAMRGYNTEEVDQYIDFLCEKYALVYRENQELQFKLNAVAENAKMPTQKPQDEISDTLLLAKTTADEILSSAKAESAQLYKSAKENTAKELRLFREEVLKEAQTLIRLRKLSRMLREEIVSAYTRGISQAQELTPEDGYDKAEEYADALVKSLLERMKNDIAQAPEDGGQHSEQQVQDKKNKPAPKKPSTPVKFKNRSVKDTIKEINRQLKTEAIAHENEKTDE